MVGNHVLREGDIGGVVDRLGSTGDRVAGRAAWLPGHRRSATATQHDSDNQRECRDARRSHNQSSPTPRLAVVSANGPSVDLNADLGEGFGVWRLGDDQEMLRLVTSAN